MHWRVIFSWKSNYRGLISYEGINLESLKQDFQGAVDDYIEMCSEEGIVPQKPYYSHHNVKISLALHKKLASFSTSHNKTLSETVKEALTSYITA